MYTQAMDTMAPIQAQAGEDVARQQRFDQRIDAGGFIEAKDWMPEHYRKTLLRQISQQFNGNRKALARYLGLSERTLYRRLQALENTPPTR